MTIENVLLSIFVLIGLFFVIVQTAVSTTDSKTMTNPKKKKQTTFSASKPKYSSAGSDAVGDIIEGLIDAGSSYSSSHSHSSHSHSSHDHGSHHDSGHSYGGDHGGGGDFGGCD